VQRKQQKQHCAGLQVPGQHSILLIAQVSLSSAITHFILHWALRVLSTIKETGAAVNITKQNNNMQLMFFILSNIQMQSSFK
jgi:hypothetical protein